MSLSAAIAGLVAFLGYAAGSFGWYRTRRGDYVPQATLDNYAALQRIGPVIGTLAAAVAVALQTSNAP